MKRIISLAIMALLIGGFTINADAQNRIKKNGESSTEQGQSSTEQAQPSTEQAQPSTQNSNSSTRPSSYTRPKGGQRPTTTQSGSSNGNTITAPPQDWAQIINEWLYAFERSITDCESENAKLQKVEKQLSKFDQKKADKDKRRGGSRFQQGTTQFNVPQANSSETKESLLTKKQNLEKSYKTDYKKAESLKKDIAKEINRVSDDQAQTYNLHERNNTLTTRFNALPQR